MSIPLYAGKPEYPKVLAMCSDNPLGAGNQQATNIVKTNYDVLGASETKRGTPRPGDDIVRAIWRHIEIGRNDQSLSNTESNKPDVNGETMVKVKGRSDSTIANLSELGLTDQSIRISVESNRLRIRVDAYGDGPPESQFMGASATVNMTLVHFDSDVLDVCIQEAWGSSPALGQLGHAGSLMGNGRARFAPGGVLGNHFIGLNLISALGSPDWRFLNTTLAQTPIEFPIGTERSLVSVVWEALPYSIDPWNNGNGSFGVPIWDHTADT